MSSDNVVVMPKRPNPAVERMILGCILLRPSHMEQAKVLWYDEFADERNALVWGAMFRLWKKGVEIDIITVTKLLAHNRQLERAGGVTHLAMLTEGVPAWDEEMFSRLIRRFKEALYGHWDA